jgi:hypothetical protein
MLVKQRTSHDCALACMAMLTGKSWAETNAIIGHLVVYDGNRPGMRDDQQALKLLGFDYSFENGASVGDISCTHRGFYISPEFYRSMAWGRRALLTVPSLNIPGGWHMVYYDGHNLFDPSLGKTYGDFNKLLPEEIIVFRETSI